MEKNLIMLKINENLLNNIFIDTDVVIALAVADDSNYSRSKKLQKIIDESKLKVFTSNFVIGEIITVLSQRIGVEFASKIGKHMMDGGITIINVSRDQMKKALKKFSEQTSKNSRFTDMINMVLMDELKIDTIFSFDKHYSKNGYKLLS